MTATLHTAPAADTGSDTALTVRLADWIDAEKLTGNYDTAGIAARIVAGSHPDFITGCLDQGGTNFLRGLCAGIKDDADLEPEEWAREEARDGHLIEDMAVSA